MTTKVCSALVRLATEEDGQDLVEYALLTAIVGLAGLGAFEVMRANMAEAYNDWTNLTTPGSIQYNWEPPPPGS